MMKPSQTLKKQSTQEQVRKRNKERGPKTRQAKRAPKRGKHRVIPRATVNQHPPAHHPLDSCYYSVMDEPQMS
jgi:hypothetical protein